MKKFVGSLVLATSIIVPFASQSAFASSEFNVQSAIVSSVEEKISERISKGFSEFEDLKAGKQIELLDENNTVTKTHVELVNLKNQLSGYMVVDHAQNYEIVEFALGDVHPLQNITSNSVYYLGPLAYAELLDDTKLKYVQTNDTFEKSELKEIKKKIENLKKYEESTGISAFNVTDYSYKVISSVPDYQQNNNTSMENDCVPTSAANVLMYWRNNGYSNISPTNSWTTVANRIGVIMGHSDSTGVSRSEIVPGLKTFLAERGYSSTFTITRDTTPTFAEMKSLINGGDPSMLSTNGWITQSGGHNVTLVGYEEYYDPAKIKWFRSVIVRDNWGSTPKDVWFQFGAEDVDDIYKIVK